MSEVRARVAQARCDLDCGRAGPSARKPAWCVENVPSATEGRAALERPVHRFAAMRIGWSMIVLAIACEGMDGRGIATGPGVGLGGDDAADDDDDEGEASTSGDGSGSATAGEVDGSGGPQDDPKFDVPAPETGGSIGCDTECECTIPDHVPCDMGTTDPFHAIGVGCPGELQVETASSGPMAAIGIRNAFGDTNTFDAREGNRYAVIGSGRVSELDSVTPNDDSDAFPTHCNDDLGDYDPGDTLPAPLRTNDVSGDCTGDAALVGTGDCSNTIHGQFSQGMEAGDYVELRFQLDVPSDVISFSYDFAFFSTEYPVYFGSEFNDMYVGWLESELWTGNVSFDADGNPISLNAGFLDFKDDDGNLPELAGTCMRQHAGTSWLTTTAGVSPGEHITVVFAIFDLSDSILDSYVFLDNWQWGCEPGPPSTEPQG
jgi:hypothetical protein